MTVFGRLSAALIAEIRSWNNPAGGLERRRGAARRYGAVFCAVVEDLASSEEGLREYLAGDVMRGPVNARAASPLGSSCLGTTRGGIDTSWNGAGTVSSRPSGRASALMSSADDSSRTVISAWFLDGSASRRPRGQPPAAGMPPKRALHEAFGRSHKLLGQRFPASATVEVSVRSDSPSCVLRSR